MLTHGNIVANLDGIQPVVPREPFYRFVSLLTLSHAFEQVIGLLLLLSRAGEVTYLQTLKPSAIEEALRRVRPNALVIVPQFLDLLRSRIESRWRGQGRGLNTAAAIARLLPMEPRRALFWPVLNRLGGDLRSSRADYAARGGVPRRPAGSKRQRRNNGCRDGSTGQAGETSGALASALLAFTLAGPRRTIAITRYPYLSCAPTVVAVAG